MKVYVTLTTSGSLAVFSTEKKADAWKAFIARDGILAEVKPTIVNKFTPKPEPELKV